MAIKFEKVNVGDILYDYHAVRAGNTMVRRWCNWEVRIIEIDRANSTALVSWNGNRPELYSRRRVERLRRKPGKASDPFGGR